MLCPDHSGRGVETCAQHRFFYVSERPRGAISPRAGRRKMKGDKMKKNTDDPEINTFEIGVGRGIITAKKYAVRMGKIILLLLLFSLTVCIPKAHASHTQSGSLNNFQKTNSYSSASFSDVRDDNWFCDEVRTVYEYGLMIGTSATTFNPLGNVTIAETITLAARLHKLYYTGDNMFDKSVPWYKSYVDYAAENGITERALYGYDNAASRADFAIILSSTFPDNALEPINQIPDGYIPDVTSDTGYADAVYRLYRAGVLTGNDDIGTFAPESNIKRSEVAAVISRMILPDKRIALKTDGTPKESEHVSVERSDKKDTAPETEAEFIVSFEPAETLPAIYNPAFVLGRAVVQNGSKNVPISVEVKNNPGIASVGLTISFDKAISLKKIEYNDLIGGNYMLPPEMSNPVKLLWINPIADKTDDFLLATLYFDVADNAAVGPHQIAMVFDEDDIYDINMNNVPFEAINGAINVEK